MRNSEGSQLRGTVERVVYQSPESDYVVLRVAPEGSAEQVVVVGSVGSIQPGETITCTGRWVLHPRFGRQFEAGQCEVHPAQTASGILKYLSSGLIPGIGEKLAERIVKRFGSETLNVIEKAPERLGEVPGIGAKKLAAVKAALERQKGARSAIIFLQEHGLGPATSAKVFRQYGPSTVAVVRENPYRLVADVSGIGFRTADQLAMTLGVDTHSPFRIQAGVVHALEEAANDGHVYLPRRQLASDASRLLRVSSSEADEAVSQLAAAGKLVLEELSEEPVYLPPLHAAEAETARSLNAMLARPPKRVSPPSPAEVQGIASADQLELSQGQKQAIESALREKCLVITGGPGVGKTTTVRALIKLFEARRLKVALCAPTGRAAKKLSQTAGAEAKTIHRLLKYNPSSNLFDHNRMNPLSADVVIVDEASMVDILLMRSLLEAVPLEARIIFVGDVDQIPPVGPGNPLREIISSGRVAVIRLTELFRQAEQSMITQNAHMINKGQMPSLESGPGRDFYFIEQEDPERVVALILQLCSENIPRRFSLHPLRDIQVVVPMHRGAVGVDNINRQLQRVLNPTSVAFKAAGREFRIGDKVMQVKNNYEKEVYNGDIGFVESVNRIEGSMTVSIDERSINYRADELDELMTAYAISVHKSQGSEYPAVVVPLLTSHFPLLQRNLLYTAVTRAKRLLVLLGSKNAVAMAISNDKVARRFSRLSWRLNAKEDTDG